jgi:oligoendopeptidase F
MRAEQLLDLDNRKGKAPGGYNEPYVASRRPFIFMNAVGSADDVETLLHEGGHAFHVFETASLPYYPQLQVPMEFAEVASMAMELLASPYLGRDEGGFYSVEDAARARVDHLESILWFWPSMAVGDAFQHWVYEHPQEARQPANCDRIYAGLVMRYLPYIDWSGLEQELSAGWQRVLHFFQVPFYYVEYGLAQLAAVQIWANSRQHQSEAVLRYREALALGYTVPLPELYMAAGAEFAFDADRLAKGVALIEATLDRLEPTGTACP